MFSNRPPRPQTLEDVPQLLVHEVHGVEDAVAHRNRVAVPVQLQVVDGAHHRCEPGRSVLGEVVVVGGVKERKAEKRLLRPTLVEKTQHPVGQIAVPGHRIGGGGAVGVQVLSDPGEHRAVELRAGQGGAGEHPQLVALVRNCFHEQRGLVLGQGGVPVGAVQTVEQPEHPEAGGIAGAEVALEHPAVLGEAPQIGGHLRREEVETQALHQ